MLVGPIKGVIGEGGGRILPECAVILFLSHAPLQVLRTRWRGGGDDGDDCSMKEGGLQIFEGSSPPPFSTPHIYWLSVRYGGGEGGSLVSPWYGAPSSNKI